MGYPTRTEGVRKNVPGGKGHTRGVIAPGQGIYEASTTPLHQVGDRLPLWGGRVFHYASFSTYEVATGDAAAGVMVAADTDYIDLTELDGEVLDLSNDSSLYDPALGEKKVEINKTSVRKNQFVNGTLHTTDDTGEGYTYLIKRNSATGEKLESDDPALVSTSSFVMELYDGLIIALDNTTEIAVMGNMFSNLVPANTADLCPVGVSMLAIDVSDKEYAWVQTWGPATCLSSSGTITKGDILVLSTTTGAVATMTAVYTAPIVGYALAAPSASGHCPVFLQLVP